ncbi:MAG: DUF4276 family protein [Pirellulaceae bacterium]
MNAKIYIEGGGDSKELHTRCREGFRRLLEKCGFVGRMPRLVACGGRGAAFADFTTAHVNAAEGDFVALLVDSEDPVADIEQTWAHLKLRDGWDKPSGAIDEQVLLMTTCMETWIISDRQALKEHYVACLQQNALPSLNNLETRRRDVVQNAMVQSTRTCKNRYTKGRKSFEILAQLNPEILRQHLPSFERCERVLGDNL